MLINHHCSVPGVFQSKYGSPALIIAKFCVGQIFLWKLNISISMFGLLFLGFCHRLRTMGALSSSPCGDKTLCDTNLIEFQSPSLTQTLLIITFSMWTWPLAHNISGLSADMEPVLPLIFLHFTTSPWLPGGSNSPLHVKRLSEVKYLTCELANTAKIFQNILPKLYNTSSILHKSVHGPSRRYCGSSSFALCVRLKGHR